MFKTLFSSCIVNPKNFYFDGEDEDERILYVFRKSFLTNLTWIFGVVGLSLLPSIVVQLIAFDEIGFLSEASPQLRFVMGTFWTLAIIGYAFINFLNWFFNILLISNKRIFDLDVTGFLYKNISEATLDNIEDVTSKVSGSIRVVFNIGSVFIQTAAEKQEFEFKDVADPAKVRDIISDLIANYPGTGGNN